ncbi:ATP-binding protein [Amycolatopsis benzoatilytica]|uniref:ATP-binding protein n=1 Tax=Amycolatopsis benzoatilytica TaxID=346045 RepID=UPI000367329C|nr:BTAD domain-containing putative transcriptional regulator [Amycolatopsis benzoatilytica]
MRVSVLGPLEVAVDRGVLEIGGARLRALLARLAVDVGRPVAVAELIDALWPEGTPVSPAASLQSLVWRLRQALPDGQVVRSGEAWYQLDLPRDAVDAFRFERLAEEGQRALRAGDAVRARQRLREALRLWRGDPLVDVAPAPYAIALGVRLREVWLTALEDRLAADLQAGPASSVVAELTELTAAHPLRERLWVLLVTALNADGRSAEALAACETVRRLLAEELGSDPGPELRQAHLAALRGERLEKGRRKDNLPAPMTSFVGRAEELARVRERMREGRLVTLVGPGGVGKTRLATTLAAELAGTVEGGVWLVELAPAAAEDDLAEAVLAALGPREIGLPAPDREALRRLTGVLAGAETLIVLDNCEHVVEPAARVVAELLARCPSVRILATSREPLGVAGERLCPVLPLPLPEPGREPDESPAVRLFADRAAAVCPGFAHSGEEVAQVCRRLDGLPLAIELAAARLRTMTLRQLATRLEDRFRVLTGGARSAPHRHRTLRAVVAWSWDLLEDDDRSLAARLAVFPSTFSAEAADHLGVAWETLDMLADKSLLQVVGERYRMLATIREYGLHRLAEDGAIDATRFAHAAFFVDLVERAAPHLHDAAQLRWLRLLAEERDNLAAALQFTAESGDAIGARRLGAVLGLFWAIHGGHAHAADRLRTALTTPGAAPAALTSQVAAQYLFHAILAGQLPDTDAVTTAGAAVGQEGGDSAASALTAALLAMAANDIPTGLALLDGQPGGVDPWQRGVRSLVRAMLAGAGGDTATMRADLAVAAARFRQAGERWGLATTLTYLALADVMADDVDTAAAALVEAITLIGELGGADHFQRTWLAVTTARAGRLDAARAELLAILRENVPGLVEVVARLCLADLARYRGDLAEAANQVEHAERLSDGGFTDALLRLGQGRLALARADLQVAETALRKAVTSASSLPDLPMVAEVAVGVAELALRRGNIRQAAAVLGAAHALRGAAAATDPDVARLAEELSTALGSASYEAAYNEGRRLGRADALAAIAGHVPPPATGRTALEVG